MRKSIQANQQGSLHLVVILIVLVAAGVGFAGYRVASTNKKAANSNTMLTARPTSFTTQTDLLKADESISTASVDQTIDTGALDQDVNNLL